MVTNRDSFQGTMFCTLEAIFVLLVLCPICDFVFLFVVVYFCLQSYISVYSHIFLFGVQFVLFGEKQCVFESSLFTIMLKRNKINV